MKKFAILSVLITVFLTSFSQTNQNQNGESPYFLVKSENPEQDKFPLTATYVDVNIAGVIADVVVKQVYINESPNTLEAIYVFPSSPNAAVYGMDMIIGNRILHAKIEEKQQARIQYEEAKEQGKTATLLEQNRPNVFQMNVANILPGDTISVELRYTELLVPKFGVYEFVYPAVVSPRYAETTEEEWQKIVAEQAKTGLNIDFDINININAGMPIQSVTSENHNVQTDLSQKTSASVALANGENKLRNLDYIIRYSLRGNEVQTGLLLYEHGDENFFLLMMQPPEAPKDEQIPPREYIFIIDVSGSMRGFPLDVSKTMLRQLISSLREQDRFNLLLFETGNHFWKNESVEATPENIEEAIKYIDEQSGDGGTRLKQALNKSFSMKKTADYSRNFIVLTDGNILVEKETFQLIRDKKGDANLFPIGIGGQINTYCIEGMAHASMSEPYIIRNQVQADSVGKNFIEFVEKPVLTNIKTEYQKFDAYDYEPASIPDVFAERPIIVFGKYKSKAKGKITISGLSGNTPYSQTFDVSEADKENNQAIRYLWARERIKYLNDFASVYETGVNYSSYRTSPTAENKQKIIDLGLKYNLLTEYTSFIAIDSLIRKTDEPKEEDKAENCDTLDLNMGFEQNLVYTEPEENYEEAEAQMYGSKRNISNRTSRTYNKRKGSNAPRNAYSSPTVNTSNEEQISEVVVTGLGIRRDVKAVGYAVTTVDDEKIDNRSALNALNGKVAGVNITQASVAPGGTTRTTVRGISTVTTTNQPLYVVDGVPIEYNSRTDFYEGNTDCGIIAEDISTITVLKGSEAVTLYGSRATNGAIIITTKKSIKHRKRLEIEISSLAEMYNPNKLPDLQSTYAQGRPVNGVPTFQNANQFENFSWGPMISATNEQALNQYDFFKTGYVFRNYAKISYRKKKSLFSASASNETESGIIPTSQLKNNNIRLAYNLEEHKNFSLQTSAQFNQTTGNRIANGANISGIMFGILTTSPTYDNANGLLPSDAVNKPDSYLFADGTQRSYNGGLTDNPYWQINRNTFSTVYDDFKFNIQPSYKIGRNFSLINRTGINASQNQTSIGFDIGSAVNPLGQYSQHFEDYLFVNSTTLLNFDKSFGYRWNLSAFAGHTYELSDRNIASNEGQIFEESGIFEMSNNMLIEPYKNNFKRETHNIFQSAEISYKTMAFLKLSTSEIITSTLPKGNNLLFSPSVSSSLVISEMFPVLKNAISFWKIRASYTQAKHEAPIFINPEYFYMQNFSINSAQYYLHRRNVVFDKNLIAEQKNEFEVGTDIRLWRGKFLLDVAYFNAETKNQIIPVQQGADVLLQNGGTLSSQGFEVETSLKIIDRRNFGWTANLNWSNPKTVVTQLDAPNDVVYLVGLLNVGSVVMEGQPYGAIYGSRYLRNENGDMIIGENGFPLVDSEYGILGDPTPDWTAGLENEFRLGRNFTISFLMEYKKGGEMWNGTKNTLNYYGVSQETANLRETTNYIFDGVKEDGTPNDIAVDFANAENGLEGNYWQMYGLAGVAEDAVEDASWFRLRDVSVSYRLRYPARFIDEMRITAYATNLYLYTPYTGIDPETNFTGASNGFGLDYFNMPKYRTFGGKLSFKF